MRMLNLKNGSSQSDIAVTSIMVVLSGLWESGVAGMCAVSHLVDRCHEPDAAIDSSIEERLKQLDLLGHDGKPNASVRDIVLSATQGRGVELVLLQSPVAA